MNRRDWMATMYAAGAPFMTWRIYNRTAMGAFLEARSVVDSYGGFPDWTLEETDG